MIEVSHLSKSFKFHRNKKLAVDDLSFNVDSGKVTGFVGPNGAGKSTTMRLMLGLDSGAGSTLYDGKRLRDYAEPSKVVGVLLDAKIFHPTRSAKNHLKVLAAAGNIPYERVDQALQLVGLSDVADKPPGSFSLGMAQRLGLAAAILGEPRYLILDEPANGLDPEGILWLRGFIRNYAKEGRAVFISSHLLSEMSQMADNIIVIGKGKLISSSSVNQLLAKGPAAVFVRASNLSSLEKELKQAGYSYTKSHHGLSVAADKTDDIGILAHQAKITLLELTRREASLEDAFLELTEDTQEYSGKGAKK
jgi:ABC-2 type transport system ATP-binding protein